MKTPLETKTPEQKEKCVMRASEELIDAIQSIQDWNGTYVGECIAQLESLILPNVKISQEAKNCGICGSYDHIPRRDGEFGYVCATSLAVIKANEINVAQR